MAKIQKPRINQFRIWGTLTLLTNAEKSTNTKKIQTQTNGHGDSMTEPAQTVKSVKSVSNLAN